jgi:hypothetical protein
MQQPLLSNGFAAKHVCIATIGNSNRGSYKQDSRSNELVVIESPASRGVKTEATALEAATRQQPVKMQQTKMI